MKQGEENFEFVKDKEDEKGNYIFQKDKITKYGFYFVGIVLVLIVLATVLM